MSCMNEHVSLAFLNELRCSFLRFFYIFVYAHISATLCLWTVIGKEASTSKIDSRLIYRDDKRERKLEGIMGKELS